MKNILLTGCSKGLGIQTLEVLLNDGYNVYGISRNYTPALDFISKKFDNQFHYIKYDLADSENLKMMFTEHFQRKKIVIHGYVNNAAIAYDDIITNMDLSRVKNMFEVNVYSPFMLTKLVIRNMLLNKVEGSIIHLSSISVHTGYKGLSMYASTKGALEGFSKNTAREWGERGIRSNCIVAGFMETEMSSVLSEDQKNRIFNRNSLKKPVDAKSVSNTIMYLISDAASSVTGQNIFVDNGTI